MGYADEDDIFRIIGHEVTADEERALRRSLSSLVATGQKYPKIELTSVAGAIDEISIHVIPVMIGEGIPLVAPRHRNIPLELISALSFPDGVVHLNYSVRR